MAGSTSSIVDNRDGNTLLAALTAMGNGGRELWVATAFFSLAALLLLADALTGYQRGRVLFGDDASPRQRELLLDRLRRLSDTDILAQREQSPRLIRLETVARLFEDGRVEARCYTAKKFHAKAYLVAGRDVYPHQLAVLGSGNFTRPGLLENIELNAILTSDQTEQLRVWYEERWAEAQADIVTEDVLNEIRRQIELYDPYWLYLKALYLWGQDRQGEEPDGGPPILGRLDEHQRQGYLQALKILSREHGAMVCDGVGLGKSYIALALMQEYCRQGKRVLLLAPKNILTHSWQGYLAEHLADYREPFGSIEDRAMTELGFDPTELENGTDALTELQRARLRLLEGYADRADLIVVDESHNFRTSSANRFKNLFRILGPRRDRRKDVLLLTATPINTQYVDVSNQLSLITHEAGRLAGHPIERIRAAARQADREQPTPPGVQLELVFEEPVGDLLQQVFEQALIQRSRTTCKDLCRAAGKELRFPIRRDPECVDLRLGPDSAAWRDLIALADARFRPGVQLLHQIRHESDERAIVRLLHRGAQGIKLSAFLTEQYRRHVNPSSKPYSDEIRLAGLVYANTLKQLESSPVAFQGILQSLGAGLLARLHVVLGDDADGVLDDHGEWVRTPLFMAHPDASGDAPDDDTVEDGANLDLSGEEQDEWLQHAIRTRHLERKLCGFTAAEFDVKRWADDIVGDLEYLREIHAATRAARQQRDPKFEQVLPRIVQLLAEGRRVLVFTQSQRTAEYLERQLGGEPRPNGRLRGHTVARIDSRVEDTRPSIIHAFCPGYNRPPDRWSPSVPERVDVLVSTDVLSEGVNLQEAGAIVNYDVHWNPVRLIQRIGRVDRRLDPEITPHDHEFRIVNVLPPPEIETILNLVGTIEDRQLKISRALGLDQSFFRADDPAGTLKEFNRLYEGTKTVRDEAAEAYTTLFGEPDPANIARLEALPPGAFGVWSGAPRDGLFAVFVMRASQATDADRERFAGLLDRPVLALEQPGRPPLDDAGAILKLLAGIPPDARSGTPSDEEQLADRLKQLKNDVRQSFAARELPRTIRPELVCWLELRQEPAR
ncbi:MAG: DEAD/DEAH box helicase family protein [Armatimonadetes bacterium]|nr:DEAD/DEAH box helicase family protein [Armatimonadota bacterium]